MEMFERAFAVFAPFGRAASAEPEKPRSEIDELRQRVNEMQKRLYSLTAGGKSEQSAGEIDELKRQLGEMLRRLDLLTGAQRES